MKKSKINSEKIEAAINDFEQAVDFELVPVIAKSSTPTIHVAWVLSTLFIFISLLIIQLVSLRQWQSWYPETTVEMLTSVFVVDTILGFLISRIPTVQRFFTPKHIRNHFVEMQAEHIFFKKRLFETKANQGLLLFISTLERRIVLLPDPRNRFHGSTKLTEEVLQIMQGHFKAAEYETGLLQAIAHLKKQLAAKFPHTTKSFENQIPNKLIWWHE